MVIADSISVSSGLFDLDFNKAVNLSSITSDSRSTIRSNVVLSTFKFAVQNTQLDGSVAWHEGTLPSGLPISPLTQSICVVEDFGGVTLFEATGPITAANKELLADVMDFAADANCTALIACVPKSAPNLKAIVASFLSVGFSTMTPCHMSLAGYVLLVNQL